MRCLYGLFTTGVIICLGCGGASTQQARYANAKKAVEGIEP
jgi:hypothetical protein